MKSLKRKVLFNTPETVRVLRPGVIGRAAGDSRAMAVAKLREIADRLEDGDLDGASVEWRMSKLDPKTGEPLPETKLVTILVTEQHVGRFETVIADASGGHIGQ